MVRGVSVNAVQLLCALAQQFGVSVDDLRSVDRSMPLAAMRCIAMETIRRNNHLSYPQLAKLFFRLDHTTAWSAVRRAPVYRCRYPELAVAAAGALPNYHWAEELAAEALEMCA